MNEARTRSGSAPNDRCGSAPLVSHTGMQTDSEVLRLPLLAAHLVPHPSATRTASGFAPITESDTQRRGKRGQVKGALFHPLYGVHPRDWPHVRLPPSEQKLVCGESPRRRYRAEVESVEAPGTFTTIQFAYPVKDERLKMVTKKVRRCAKGACAVNTRVRVDDGATGGMVGVGRHFSFRGVNEAYVPQNKKKAKKQKLDVDDQASMLAQVMDTGAWEIFRGAPRPEPTPTHRASPSAVGHDVVPRMRECQHCELTPTCCANRSPTWMCLRGPVCC